MTYEVLERQIRALPEAAQREVAHYVGYLSSVYGDGAKNEAVKERIHAFMRENPAAFDEFAPVRGAGIEAIRELTKNDEW